MVTQRTRARANGREKVQPSSVVGRPGLSIWRGTVNEEYLKELTPWSRAAKVYRQMEDDEIIGALLDAIRVPLLASEFDVPAVGRTRQDEQAAEFVWDAMNGMDITWREHVEDTLSVLVFGFALSEMVLRKDESGRLMLATLLPLGQETLDRWGENDQLGSVDGFWQRDPETGAVVFIPSEKLLHFTLGSRKRDPQGKSLLRSLYRPWYFRNNLQTMEAIGVERDVGGMPVGTLPENVTLGPTDRLALEKALSSLRNDEAAYLVLPHGVEVKGYGGGNKIYDAREIIRDLGHEMRQRFFADFIAAGAEQVGTQALVREAQSFLALALRSIQQRALEEWNGKLVPFLFKWNQLQAPGGLPKIEWLAPGKDDLGAMATAISSLVNTGVLTTGPELEDYVRNKMGLPDKPALPPGAPWPGGPPGGPAPGGGPPGGPAPGASFQKEAPSLRRGTQQYEQVANDYQQALVTAYDAWAARVGRTLERQAKRHYGVDKLAGTLDTTLGDLQAALLHEADTWLMEAFYVGLGDEEPQAADLTALAERKEKTRRWVTAHLMPDLRNRFMEELGAVSDAPAVWAEVFEAQRSRVAEYAGGAWAMVFEAQRTAGMREDAESVAAGGAAARVRWVLDPEAEHCGGSRGYFGCPDLENEYPSWSDLPTVPAGDVTCRGNCRCAIEVFNAANDTWERVT